MIRRLLQLLLAVGLSVQAQPAGWIRLTTPNFELFTDQGEKSGRETILYFEQVRGFFVQASPVRPPAEFPVRIIAFKNREEFAAFSPNALMVAFYAPGPKRDYIVLQDVSPASYSYAVHEYMHLVVRHSGLRIPTWLNEGWADVYSSLKPVKGGAAIGDLIPGRMETLTASTGNWIDFDILTRVDERSPIYNEGDRTGVFYAESWALAHMLFLAPDYRDNFGKFLLALHRGATAAQACQSAYGKIPSQVFLDLQNYFARKKIFGTVFKTTLVKAESEPVVADVPEFDARVMLADLLVTVGKPQEARREYVALEKLQPGRPDIAQSLGYAALAANDAVAARTNFRKAFAAGEPDPQMCLALAVLERAENRPPAEILPILERAVKSKPDYAEALLQLGLTRVVARQYRGAVDALMSIQTVTPERAPPLFASLAYAYLQTGDLGRARMHLDTALKWAKTPQETANLKGLGILMEARASSAFPPKPGERLERLEGMLDGLDCGAGGPLLRLNAGGQIVAVRVPDTRAVELVRSNENSAADVKMQCGPAKPVPIALEYVPMPNAPAGVAGVLRRLEY
jgi:Flp pilus assembly protein TadD